ncbi:hypothetical protein M9Y10_021334 [Tritrichomonas musculus]|uniref:Uncharacterized protein n=1 Tax=Tritrichomonas musculus TaxID=1915356 RepID=A0ABR2HDN5_9EUKA
MELHFVDISGFNGKYEISIEEPHIVREKITQRIVEEWYNGYGDVAVLLNNSRSEVGEAKELYLIGVLLQLINYMNIFILLKQCLLRALSKNKTSTIPPKNSSYISIVRYIPTSSVSVYVLFKLEMETPLSI